MSKFYGTNIVFWKENITLRIATNNKLGSSIFKSVYFVFPTELKTGIRRETNEFSPQLHILFIDIKPTPATVSISFIF